MRLVRKNGSIEHVLVADTQYMLDDMGISKKAHTSVWGTVDDNGNVNLHVELNNHYYKVFCERVDGFGYDRFVPHYETAIMKKTKVFFEDGKLVSDHVPSEYWHIEQFSYILKMAHDRLPVIKHD